MGNKVKLDRTAIDKDEAIDLLEKIIWKMRRFKMITPEWLDNELKKRGWKS